jgi:hypothetical protein
MKIPVSLIIAIVAAFPTNRPAGEVVARDIMKDAERLLVRRS